MLLRKVLQFQKILDDIFYISSTNFTVGQYRAPVLSGKCIYVVRQ